LGKVLVHSKQREIEYGEKIEVLRPHSRIKIPDHVLIHVLESWFVCFKGEYIHHNNYVLMALILGMDYNVYFCVSLLSHLQEEVVSREENINFYPPNQGVQSWRLPPIHGQSG
jgi:hypothetical protein